MYILQNIESGGHLKLPVHNERLRRLQLQHDPEPKFKREESK